MQGEELRSQWQLGEALLPPLEVVSQQTKDALIEVLMNQVMDLTMMSKIELGDDVIEEIKRLKEIIDKPFDGDKKN